MNRYIASCIASDLEGGARIGVYVARYQTAINLIVQISEYLDEQYSRTVLPKGKIEHDSGGEVIFFTDETQARGLNLDVLVMPHGSALDFPHRLDPRTELIEY